MQGIETNTMSSNFLANSKAREWLNRAAAQEHECAIEYAIKLEQEEKETCSEKVVKFFGKCCSSVCGRARRKCYL